MILQLTLLAALGGAVFLAPAGAADVYRLNEERGGVHYTDRLPPERVREGHTVLDAEGREKKTLPPVGTPEEQEAERLRQEQRRERERLVREQIQRDMMLIKLYATEDAINTARDARLEGVDSQRAVLVNQMLTNRQRMDLLLREDPTSDEIPHLRRKMASDESAVRNLLQERLAIEARFAADLERWRTLKSGGGVGGPRSNSAPASD